MRATARRFDSQVPGGGGSLRVRKAIHAAAFAARLGLAAVLALGLGTAGVQAFDDAKYPDWKGQWTRIGSGQWDPSKTGGPRQQQADLCRQTRSEYAAQ